MQVWPLQGICSQIQRVVRKISGRCISKARLQPRQQGTFYHYLVSFAGTGAIMHTQTLSTNSYIYSDNDLQPLAKELGIKVVPTFKILKGSKVVKEVTGAKYDDLVAAIEAASQM